MLRSISVSEELDSLGVERLVHRIENVELEVIRA